jgi:Leucine-rich repeat (LRR) protein
MVARFLEMNINIKKINMKKIISLLLSAVLSVNAAKSQAFDAHDVEELRRFLNQPSAVAGWTNGEQLGLEGSGLLVAGDAGWVWRVYGFYWTMSSSNRLTMIYIGDFCIGNYCKNHYLSGDLSLSLCDSLSSIYIPDSKLTSMSLSNCQSLSSVYMANNRLTTLSISGCRLLTDLRCHNNALHELDLSDCKSLTLLHCAGNPLTDMTVSFARPLPQGVNERGFPLLSFGDVSGATLHVPVGTAALYRAADEWKKFGTIIEDPALSTAFLPSPLVTVFSVGTTLSVLSPSSETLTLYSPSGSLLFRSSKLPGHVTFTIGHLPKGVIIVKGSTGWVRKLFR